MKHSDLSMIPIDLRDCLASVIVAGDLAIHCPYMLYGVIVCVGVRCMCSVSYER